MRAVLSQTLRSTLNQAQIEARDLNQEFVGTEHLMLGILHCEECEAARLLRLGHVQREQVRSALLNALPHAQAAPGVTGDLPLSHKAQHVINAAVEHAGDQPAISTRMLLAALLEEPRSAIVEAIARCGGDVEQLKSATMRRPVEVEE
jgi:ATP-dependent Clp protease ATP-binding subunit ClpC